MKELSIEEKAKRYDDLLVKLQEAKVDDNVCDERYCCVIDNIVPELKESEDETVINNIKKVITWYRNLLTEKSLTTEQYNEIFAWLEKQGEQKAKYHDVCDKCTRQPTCQSDCFLQQGEQKPADKVEPKFKVGDWVVDNNGIVKQILSYKDGVYKHTGGYSATIFEDEWRMWDITKDAKDGDVLVCKDYGYNSYILFGEKYIHCWYNGQTEHFYSTTSCKLRKDATIIPATKEQRDLLFKKMREAGYTFDFEKKELKKIVNEEQIKKNLQDNSFRRMFEQKPVEWHREDEQNLNACLGYIQDEFLRRWLTDAIYVKYDKPAWSEEDETRLTNNIIMLKEGASLHFNKKDITKAVDWLKSIKDRVQSKREWSEEDKRIIDNLISQLGNLYARKLIKEETKDKYVNWLKSLRPQNTWKPSDEQMEALYEETQKSERIRDNRIVSLYEDLKKLRGEQS